MARWPWWLSGAIAILLIASATLMPLLAMIREAGSIQWTEVLGNTYIQRVIRFSIVQATISTVLSLATAIPVALALSHKPGFPGRSLVVTVFSLSLVIPTIVAIFGIVAVFGRTGWFNAALSVFSFAPMGFYGLPGILIAHVFFNMPLATRILLSGLEGIPEDNWRLCRQLGMQPWSIFRHIEWHRIKARLPGLALLIFTLCFTSFAIVMTLGGGPRSTTIEVAIYQSLRFDFDIQMAVALASIQLLICLALMALSTLIRHDGTLGFHLFMPAHTPHPGHLHNDLKSRLWDGPMWNAAHWSVIVTASLFVLLPLLAMALSAFNSKTIAVLTDPSTLLASINTLLVALVAATLSVTLALGILNSTRHMRTRLGLERTGQWVQLSGNVILVLPPLVLGTGLFLLLRTVADVFSLALVLVVIINSLMALPFVLRILNDEVMNAASHDDRLLQSLGIQGWNRWRLIDWPQLRRPLSLSFALSATLAAGDLSAIALFGSERVRTLPLLLYQRMGSYRLEEAAVTAGMLLALCLLLYVVIQWLLGGRRHAAT
ncbi:MAG: thiamine/thiamine pyrophosphate ABC transporter, permease protein [Granulosicoccus sp.]|nr:thiamine/thiamine pyrophosphate ABC transporter, permease protein [Granulosicoccus sp.]